MLDSAVSPVFAEALKKEVIFVSFFDYRTDSSYWKKCALVQMASLAMKRLLADYPWIRGPLVAGAPMRLISLAPLAVEVSRGGRQLLDLDRTLLTQPT